jgi:hypothetical protein
LIAGGQKEPHSDRRSMEHLGVYRAAVPKLLPSYTKRRWMASFGLSLAEVEDLWLLPEVTCSPEHLLWFLYFVKVYPTESAAACWAECDEKTWRKQLKLVASLLNVAMPPVGDPFESSKF